MIGVMMTYKPSPKPNFDKCGKLKTKQMWKETKVKRNKILNKIRGQIQINIKS